MNATITLREYLEKGKTFVVPNYLFDEYAMLRNVINLVYEINWFIFAA